jgi:hypothetical protein
MATVTPVQSVESKGEVLAVELAEMLLEGKKTEAQNRLQSYADDHKLAYWEAAAIADIASRMVHGRPWKKT